MFITKREAHNLRLHAHFVPVKVLKLLLKKTALSISPTDVTQKRISWILLRFTRKFPSNKRRRYFTISLFFNRQKRNLHWFPASKLFFPSSPLSVMTRKANASCSQTSIVINS